MLVVSGIAKWDACCIYTVSKWNIAKWGACWGACCIYTVSKWNIAKWGAVLYLHHI